MAAGCVSRAIFSTHLSRWLFLLRGIAGSRPFHAEPASVATSSWRTLMLASFPSASAVEGVGQELIPEFPARIVLLDHRFEFSQLFIVRSAVVRAPW